MKFETVLLENAGIQLIDGDRGKNYPKQSDFKNSGHCLFLSAKNVTKTGFKFEEVAYIDSERDKLLRAGKLERGDIVVTTRGTIGNIAFYDDSLDFEHIRINSGMMIFRVQDSRWNKRFLYFLLQSPYIQSQIESLTSGSAVPQLPARDLKKFSLPKIPINVQDKIEKIISSFTAKLEKNSQINQTLEQIAQAIFKSWFVDFEPVKAKIAAREALTAEYKKQSGKAPSPQEIAEVERQAAIAAIAGAGDIVPTAQLQTLADLFPSQLVESELGEIPEGWEYEHLEQYIDVLETGKRPKGGVKGLTTGVPSVGAENIIGVGNYNFGKEKFVTEDFFQTLKKGIVQDFDFLLYKDGGKPGDFKPRVSMFGCGFPYERFAINEHVFRIRSAELGQPFLYFQIGHERVLADLRHKGAKAAIPGINQKDVKTIKILSPSNKALIEQFNKIAESNLRSILERSKESLTLAQVRDALLPKLLSGEIDLKTKEMINA